MKEDLNKGSGLCGAMMRYFGDILMGSFGYLKNLGSLFSLFVIVTQVIISH